MKNFETLVQAMQENPAEVSSYLQHAARYSERYNLDVLTFDELPWSGDADATTMEIVKQLRQFGIEEFWIAESSTALNKSLIRLMQNGVTITGGEVVVVPSPIFSWNEDIPVLKCAIGGANNE
jgi:hypothetical protein